eukprot:Protomagalhaensia_wolfi_Nauph_80__12@NODE_100_length_3716_cov_303_866195_g43_i1_p1_GENE_NODE_100_length_3716_cov_303_866195_g43_i1NODE_100_length_3716_cov_303_866195_g43_i1_p1_ORF_typecomplete_len400_score53_13Nop14/PF04147_12/0_46_NODE_100_length_3716_cov_303_866195_g43_i113272526
MSLDSEDSWVDQRDEYWEDDVPEYERLFKALDNVLDVMDFESSIDAEIDTIYRILNPGKDCIPVTYALRMLEHLNRASKSTNKEWNMTAIAKIAIELCNCSQIPSQLAVLGTYITLPLDQDVFSFLITTSNEPTVLTALCSLFLQSQNSTQMTLVPLAHRTLLSRCLELLPHPSQSLREAVIAALVRVFNDCAELRHIVEDCDLAAQTLVTECRGILAWPRAASSSSLPALLSTILTEYSHYTQNMMDSGIMDDVLSLIYMDAIPVWCSESWAQFLEVFIEVCTLQQVSLLIEIERCHKTCFQITDLVESGLIGLLLSWVKRQHGRTKNTIAKIVVRVYRAGDQIRKEQKLEKNPFAHKYLSPTISGGGWRNNETLRGFLNRCKLLVRFSYTSLSDLTH